jgi:hypothetical protein
MKLLSPISVAAGALFLLPSSSAFSVVPEPSSRHTTALQASPKDRDGLQSRRSLLGTAAAAAVATAFATNTAAPAHATYSAYTRREEDWQMRQKKGEIEYKTARDLRSQLAEIAPMNVNDKIFCPNGPSAAVSPLMENRCGDRLATPSVFGRTEDVLGNSIPGSYRLGSSSTTSSSEALATQMPEYGFTTKSKKK